MKLIDRYVATTFLKNYLLSFLVLVGMYVVMDMIFNFDELVEVTTRTQQKVEANAAAGNNARQAPASGPAMAADAPDAPAAAGGSGLVTIAIFIRYVADF